MIKLAVLVIAPQKMLAFSVLGQPVRRGVQRAVPSTTREVMNDGIGRISPSLMKRVRDELGLTENSCAIQARISGAKGMWNIDNGEPGVDFEDWIEIFPRQEK